VATIDEIRKILQGLGQGFPAGAEDKFADLLAELSRWNRRVNLTAITQPRRMVTAHLADSLVARPLLRGVRILDVGTGAGFPGLPLAIAEPDRAFVLLDSNARKIAFVQHVARLLGLDNVEAVQARAENFAPASPFDTVIARAVASLSRLLTIAGRLVGEDGVFLALKGRYPAGELEEVGQAWRYDVTELAVPGYGAGSRHAVLLEHRKK
jgi:16S rRNA (guanine527-N7)-methyltransferase